MAMQNNASVVYATQPPAEVVGNAFVQQYYHVLHTSPSDVYRFYHDSSLLSRPDSHNGVMKTVTTTRAISDMIMSLNYDKLKTEIHTVVSQVSHERGILISVTGCMTGKEDNVRKKFAQSFFLAPQATGFFVSNDVLHFVEEKKPFDVDSGLENDIQESASMPPLTIEPVPAASITLFEKEKDIKDEEVEDEEVHGFIFVNPWGVN